MSEISDDFPDAVETIRRSLVWTIVDGMARVWRASASESRFVAWASRAGRAFEALPRHERRRALFITVAVAAAVHALLLGLVPPLLRPALPRTFWIVVSVAAAVAVVRGSGGTGQASDA